MPFNPDRINIHELTIEETEKQEETFDVERDLTKEDWTAMKDALGELKKDSTFDRWGYRAVDMKIIFPEKVRELGFSRNDWEKMERNLEEEIRHESALSATNAMNMKILFPDKIKEVGFIDKSEKVWKTWKKMLEDSRKDLMWINIQGEAPALKVLFPGKVNELKLDEAVWCGIKNERSGYRNTSHEFLWRAANARILFPERMDEIKSELSWGDMRRKLNEYRLNNEWASFIGYAANMKILAAEKVEVTDKGLEITMPTPKLKSDTPPFPEVKKF